MSRPILFMGIDIALSLNEIQCKALKQANYRFVCRYYSDSSHPRMKWKVLQKDEAQIISNAGLALIVIYESFGHEFKIYSKETGKEDCLNSIRCAQTVGQPLNSTIYFAVDSIIGSPEEMDHVYRYFSGIYEEMEKYKHLSRSLGWNIGAYGSYYVIENIYGKFNVQNYWQTIVWSNGYISDKANFLQAGFYLATCGISDFDEDYAFSYNLGQFRI